MLEQYLPLASMIFCIEEWDEDFMSMEELDSEFLSADTFSVISDWYVSVQWVATSHMRQTLKLTEYFSKFLLRKPVNNGYF